MKELYSLIERETGFNPYFTGLPILMYEGVKLVNLTPRFNPYFTGLPILIPSFFFVNKLHKQSFNPYFTGLPILIMSISKYLF